MSDTQERPVSQLIQQAREFANDLEDAISAHKGNFEDWIRDDGKRSVVIVEYQLNKNSLGEETRLVNELADALSEYEQREQALRDKLPQIYAYLDGSSQGEWAYNELRTIIDGGKLQ